MIILCLNKTKEINGSSRYICRGETTRPPELSRPSRRVRDPNVNGWLNFAKK